MVGLVASVGENVRLHTTEEVLVDLLAVVLGDKPWALSVVLLNKRKNSKDKIVYLHCREFLALLGESLRQHE